MERREGEERVGGREECKEGKVGGKEDVKKNKRCRREGEKRVEKWEGRIE